MATKITKSVMAEALTELAGRDPDIRRAYGELGPPPLRGRRPGFDSLFKIICAQQVSTASARAIQARLNEYADPMTPEVFLGLTDDDHRKVGLSRQKGTYGRAIARALVDGDLSLRSVARQADDDAIEAMTALKGIGPWTAQVYLLFALKRPDLWPVDDLGIVVGYQKLKGLPERPTRAEMLEAGEIYRPWRSVAARFMWHVVNSERAEKDRM